MIISVYYPTCKRGWRNDYAAAGLFHFWLWSLLDRLLFTEVGGGLLSGLRRHVGDCLQPGASWQSTASCLMATAYPAVVPALPLGIQLSCDSNRKKISDLVILIL